MYTKQHLQSYIDTYNDCYNTSFTELTERYSLFPKGDNEYGYTKEWPNDNMPGVYFVLDQNEELLYIGQPKSLEGVSKSIPSSLLLASPPSCTT